MSPRDKTPLTPSPRENPAIVEHSNDEPIKTTGDPLAREEYTDVNDSTANVVTPETSTFLILKELLETNTCEPPCDDEVTTAGTNRTLSNSCRLNLMFSMPDEESSETNDCITEAVHAMNELIEPLINKIPSIRLCPWLTFPSAVKKKEYLKRLPNNVDIVERYVYDFSRSIAFGQKGFCRIQVVFPDSVTVDQITHSSDKLRIPRVQHLRPANSDALYPYTIGTLTGSVRAMAFSKDFHRVFKSKFGLRHLGLWWTMARTKSKGQPKYSSTKNTLHIEIDRCDEQKVKNIASFFNSSSRKLEDNFFGTPMVFCPVFDYFASDETKQKIVDHAGNQDSLGKSIKCISLTGIQPNNWYDKQNKHTLLRHLMTIESLYEKSIASKDKKWKGRLFYAIIPDSDSHSVSFYFSNANYYEGRSVVRGLPCFIQETLLLEPSFYCSSDLLSAAVRGEWDNAKRSFVSEGEKLEQKQLSWLNDCMLATNTNFVSVAHQKAMAMEDDSLTEESRLTKKDAEPPTVGKSAQLSTPDSDSEVTYDDSATGSTTESKAKKYAAAARASLRKELASSMQAKDSQIAELQAQLASLRQGTDGKDGANMLVDTDEEDANNNSEDTSGCVHEEIEESEEAFKDHDMTNRDPLFNVVRSPARKLQKTDAITTNEGEDGKSTATSGNGTPFRKGRDEKSTYVSSLQQNKSNVTSTKKIVKVTPHKRYDKTRRSERKNRSAGRGRGRGGRGPP